MYKNKCLILRGFAYKENYLAGGQSGPSASSRGKRRGVFLNSFLSRIDIYKKLIFKLKKNSDIDIYLSTYDSTPKHIIDELNNTQLFTSILLFPEINSYQWTTTLGCLDYLSKNNLDYLSYIILRNDLIDMTDIFIDTLCSYDNNHKYIYTLIKQYGRKSDIDILQIIPKIELETYYNFISNKENFHAHYIFYKLYPKVKRLFEQESKQCLSTEVCKFLYTLDGCGCKECLRKLKNNNV